MPSIRKSLIVCAALAATVASSLAMTSSAEARHHRRAGPRLVVVEPVLIPAHERPGFVHAVGPGLIDLGLGPVFPFGGWPSSL